VDLTGFEIVDVELPLSAPLFDEHGHPLDILLFGIIDLLLKDASGSGNLIIVDSKTSKQKKSQSAVDDDLQMTAYSYLLSANGYTFPRAEVQCRMDVLRKLKKPTMEYYHTTRTAEDRKRLAKLTTRVLAGIENRIFYPVKSWMCADCQYRDACKDW
jgi:putative RecB family exonuclease